MCRLGLVLALRLRGLGRVLCVLAMVLRRLVFMWLLRRGSRLGLDGFVLSLILGVSLLRLGFLGRGLGTGTIIRRVPLVTE